MARESVVVAAGGIVVQRGASPLIAVVQMRKRTDWVLPKGKLDPGEAPRDAAEREVLEETGHAVSVHEFLGTLAYPLGERTKVVHFWRMEADAEPCRKLMKDIAAVEWLPLDRALARLTRQHEQAFLAQVGPQAIAPDDAAQPLPRPPLVPEPAPRGVLQKFWQWLAG
ncbi:MAG TPA: NUDIX domain-containing protein [Tardiphaga sp.]